MKRILKVLSSMFRKTPPRDIPHRAEAIKLIMPSIDSDFYRSQLEKNILDDPYRLAVHYVDIGHCIGLDPAPEFSTVAYLEENLDVQSAGINSFYHYLRWGRHEGRIIRRSRYTRAPSPIYDEKHRMAAIVRPYIDCEHYRGQISVSKDDLIVVDYARHYLDFGAPQGLDPSSDFSTDGYRAEHPEVDWSCNNPLVHSIENRLKLDKRIYENITRLSDVDERVLNEFDADFYLAQNKDVRNAAIDPALHFFSHGWKEGRDPAENFSVQFYLEKYEDVKKAGINPFVHYVRTGRSEGRFSSVLDEKRSYFRAVESEFDCAYYLRQNPDVAASGVDPFTHFMEHGWRELRSPSYRFSVKDYLENNPDVRATGENPLLHYVLAGRREGRLGRIAGGFRSEQLRNQIAIQDQLAERTHNQIAAGQTHEEVDYLFQGFNSSHTIYVTVSQDNFLVNIGGIQLCIMREAEQAKANRWHHVHLFPSVAMPTISDKKGQYIGVLENGHFRGYFNPEKLSQRLAEIKKRSCIVAVHSFIGHHIDDVLIALAALSPTKVVYWLHDYSSVCASFTLMRNDVAYCNAPNFQSTACQICIYGEMRQAQHVEHKKFFHAFSPVVLAPSEIALQIWRRSFPSYGSHLVFPHCKIEASELVEASFETKLDRGSLRVAFLGWPSLHKGWPVFLDLAEHLAKDERYRFFHFGGEGDPKLPIEFVPVAVGYEDMSAMIHALSANAIDVALIWSLWPETFCFTAHEAIAAGARLITNTQSGNVKVLAENNGDFVFDSEASLFAAFENGEIYTKYRRLGKKSHKKLNFGKMTMEVI